MAGISDPGYSRFAFPRQCAKVRRLRKLRQKSCCVTAHESVVPRSRGPVTVRKKLLILFLLYALAGWSRAFADEETRQVQEELRKRHLFFRDIDGRPSPEYSMALKRYQQRQGFAQTGYADEVTLYSLGIGAAAPSAEGARGSPSP